MLLWRISCILLLQIFTVFGGSQKFKIINKKSGLVLDAKENPLEVTPWEKKDTQLWTLEWARINNTLQYFVHNVGIGGILDASPETKEVLIWGKHHGPNQLWSLQPFGYTKFKVQYYPDHFMSINMYNNVEMYETEQNDGSDEWKLIVVRP